MYSIKDGSLSGKRSDAVVSLMSTQIADGSDLFFYISIRGICLANDYLLKIRLDPDRVKEQRSLIRKVSGVKSLFLKGGEQLRDTRIGAGE